MSTQGLNVCIRNQDITTVKAHVLVSSIHRSKDMKKGPLASCVLSKFGQSVQNDLNRLATNELEHGKVVSVTPAPQNSDGVKQLMFLCLYEWRDGNDKFLSMGVRECLEKAAEQRFTSIAFPALGMGGQGYPPYTVALTIASEIADFIYTDPDTCLREVHIVLLDKNRDSVRSFLQVTSAYFKGLATGRDIEKNPIEGKLGNNVVVTGMESSDIQQIVFERPTRRTRDNGFRQPLNLPNLGFQDVVEGAVSHSGFPTQIFRLIPHAFAA